MTDFERDIEVEEELLEENEDVQGTLSGRIEAILFVAGEPVRIEDLAKALNVTVRAVENEVVKLRDEYDFHQRGFTLKRFGHQVQLATRALYATDVVHLLQPVQKQSLTQAAMETLAVVAYKQPVTRAEVEQVRGVKCDYSIQSLVNKELIMEVGRKDTLGRPILYGTTENFLSHFGLTTLEDLPPMPEAPQPEKTEEPDFDVPELTP
ncbi:MAG: SMC-Scp complex subunit ScpB [Clostridiales bacterium]|nr:SMC-Scp complex subunit ScpB [Clostridiales bacterium]